MRCENKRCRAALEVYIDSLGRTIARCRPCERRRKGLCVQCNAPRWSKHSWGKYCTTCAKEADRKAVRKYQANNADLVREKARLRMAAKRAKARAGKPPVSGKERAAKMHRWAAEHTTPAERQQKASRAGKVRWQKYYQRQMLRKMREQQEKR